MPDEKPTTGERKEVPKTLPSPPEHDWLDPGTWSNNLKYTPLYIAFGGVLLSLLYLRFFHQAEVDLSTYESCVGTFDYGFRINAASTQAHDWSHKPREIGMAYEATLQIYNPERSIFGPDPFPGGKPPKLGMRMDEAALYAREKVKLVGGSLLDQDGDSSVSGPATMGIAALMLAQRWPKEYMLAAMKQKDVLLEEAPRHSNGAISHRLNHVEVRSEAIGMFAPFLAYYGVATNDLSVVEEAVRQCRLYRDALIISEGPTKGLWNHIADSAEFSGAWSSGNAWAAYGMAQVIAIITAWPTSNTTLSNDKNELVSWITEIIDGAMRTDTDDSKLLRNFMGEDEWSGETTGTSLLAATVYRMASIAPDIFAQDKYLDWAHEKRRAIFQRVGDDGFVRPAAYPYISTAENPAGISPEGESFLILLGTAWRDCVCSGRCSGNYHAEIEKKPSGDLAIGTLASLWKRILSVLRAL